MTEQQARLKIVAWALERLGTAKNDERHKQIIDTYNSFLPHPRGYKMPYTADWCAAFVSAAAISCGMTELFPIECSCGEQVKMWQRMGRWKENDAYIPQIGDVIYYDWQDSGNGDCTGAPDHVGIVTDVTKDRLCIVEGNKGTKSTVATRMLTVNARYIRGYGCPDYASLVLPETCKAVLPVLSKGSKGGAVQALQTLFNLRCQDSLDIDGSFGPATDAALRAFQRGAGLEADGSVGPLTWAALVEG